jgi:hypothetical protein
MPTAAAVVVTVVGPGLLADAVRGLVWRREPEGGRPSIHIEQGRGLVTTREEVSVAETDMDIDGGGWLGQVVIDEDSHHIGKVVDVVYDDDTSKKPHWAVVGSGPLRSHHFVPLASAYRTSDGRLVVPFDPQVVKRSPKAGRDHEFTPDLRERTLRHYGIAR